jgi:hypothetical protein
MDVSGVGSGLDGSKQGTSPSAGRDVLGASETYCLYPIFHTGGRISCAHPALIVPLARRYRAGVQPYSHLPVDATDDATGSYGSPPVVDTMSDHHMPSSPEREFRGPPTHLPTGQATQLHSQPLNKQDDATGSYAQPPVVHEMSDHHKAHMP